MNATLTKKLFLLLSGAAFASCGGAPVSSSSSFDSTPIPLSEDDSSDASKPSEGESEDVSSTESPHTVTLRHIYDGSAIMPSAYIEAAMEEGGEYLSGASMTVTLNALDRKAFFDAEADYGRIYVMVGEQTYLPEVSEDDDGAKTMSFEATVPSEDFDIITYYQELTPRDSGATLSLTEGSKGRILGYQQGQHYDHICLLAVMDEHCTPSDVAYSLDGENFSPLLGVNGNSLRQSPRAMNMYNLTVWPNRASMEGEVTLSIGQTEHQEYSITYEGLDLARLDMDYSQLPMASYDGQRVNVSYAQRKGASPVKLTSQDVELTLWNTNYYVFDMPRHDVTLRFVDATPTVPLTYANNEDVVAGYFYSENDFFSPSKRIDKGCDGDTAFLFVQPQEGKKAISAQVGEKTVPFSYATKDDDGHVIFMARIPVSKDMGEVEITCVDAFTATISTEGLTLPNGPLYAAGETVKVRRHEEGDLEVYDTSKNLISLTVEVTAEGFVFAMPECDILLRLSGAPDVGND